MANEVAQPRYHGVETGDDEDVAWLVGAKERAE